MASNNVPLGAAKLLDFIGLAETGRSDPEAYGVIVFHQQHKLPKSLTDYTIDELMAAQKLWAKNGWSIKGKKWRGSAAGKYQIIRPTLAMLVKRMDLPGSAKFTPDLQDRMGLELLTIRGWQAFSSGQVSAGAFALQLAREWASMPVLSTTAGRHRTVHRGESYYAGDGVNKSQTRADELEAILAAVRKPQEGPRPIPAPSGPPKPALAPQRPPERNTRGTVGLIIFATTAIAAGLAVAWQWIAEQWGSLISFIGGF